MTGPLRVIAHEGTRTGSPRVLLELLRHAAPLLDAPLSMTVLAGGGLAAELLELDDGVDPAERPGALLVNGSIAAGELARVPLDVPAAVYVHEEGTALDALDATARAMLADRSDMVLCVSENSRRDLVALGVPAERIHRLSPVIVERAGPGPGSLAEARRAMTSGDARLVVGCGEAGWRKGADLFLDVARRLSTRSDVAFAWVGGGPRAFGRLLKHDSRRLGLADRLRWVGEVEDVDPFLAAAELLIFPSREDPQPLVPLEAALLGTPTVGFAVGGLASLAADDAAAAVPYPDTVRMAQVASDLLDSEPMRRSLADRAAERARSEQSLGVLGPRFVELMRSLLHGGGG